MTNDKGDDERRFLEPVQMIVSSGRTVADDMLESFEKKWDRNIDRVFTDLAF